MKHKKYLEWILIASSGLVLLIFLWWHYKVGMVRYFDADEYAHMHWAAHILTGKRPFVDFLVFIPPGFQWFLTPAFWSGWGTIQPFLTARFLIFVVFTALAGVSGLLFWEQRRSLAGALLAAALVSFLPLPFDKYLEIRPDNPATLLILLAVFFQIKWMKKGRWLWGAVSGVLYVCSYLVLPKMVPNILVGVGIAAWYVFDEMKRNRKSHPVALWNAVKPFFLGLAVPTTIYILYMFSLGDIPSVIYWLTKLPLEINLLGKYFIMMPTLFFYPNGMYYGQDGYTQGLYVNHAVWIIGLTFGIYRMFTPYLAVPNERVRGELLISLNCFVQVIFFVLFAPLKHAQYLIPIGVFVAWYGADAIISLRKDVSKSLGGAFVFTACFLAGSVFLYNVFVSVNGVKLGWSNTLEFAKLADLYKKIPFSEYVLDLDGRMLYNPDPYYACCNPFGQFAGFLSRPLPDLPQALEKTGTKYIYQGGLERVKTLPWQHQEYIYDRFMPLDGDKTILIRK